MGSGDQRATQQEIMSMIRDQSFGIKSQKSIPDTNIDMLSREALTDFRGEVRAWFHILTALVMRIFVKVSESPTIQAG